MLIEDLKQPQISDNTKYSAKDSSLLYSGYVVLSFAEQSIFDPSELI